MKLSYFFLTLLVPLSACTLFGGPQSPLSEKCYTAPQTSKPAPLAFGSEGAAYVPGRLLVSYRGSGVVEPLGAPERALESGPKPTALQTTARRVRQRYGLAVLGQLGGGGLSEIVRVPTGTDVTELAETLRRDPRVRYAEPDYYLYPLGVPEGTLPNDPLLSEQWHLLDFGLPEAWGLETGERSVVLAVLDSGVDLTHEDLAGRALPGCDVYNGDNNPNPGPPSQLGADQRHGTHVAGIALATGDNSKGVAGVAYSGVRLLPVKVFDDSGADAQRTATSVVTRAIHWAAGLSVEGMNRNPYPADIINLSLGGKGSVQSLNAAVQDARDAGSLVVAASGNSSSSDAIFAPANAPGALAVGSVDDDYGRSYFSNYSAHRPLGRPHGSRRNGATTAAARSTAPSPRL
jgi:subtilisin family serine protease